MKPGDVIWVRVFKADGRPHRQWQARVESAAPEAIVTVSPANSLVFQADRYSAWTEHHLKRAMRSYYWLNRRHNLLEVYNDDGSLHELYADICSPAQVVDGEVHFVDHELDVSLIVGEAPRIVDQDEFAEAAAEYGYSDQFVRQSYELAESLLGMLATWRPLGLRLLEASE